MRKIFILLLLSLFLSSLHAMEDVTEEMKGNNSINKILKVDDPIKFNILARKFIMENHPDIKRERFQKKMIKKEKLKLLQDSMDKITALNTSLIEELDELGHQSVQQCSRARQRGSLYTIIWFTSTAALLGVEGYLLFQELSTETKVASGVALFTTAYGTVTKFLENANKIINNTHINEQIEKQSAKVETLAKLKYDIRKDIKSLTKKIHKKDLKSSLSKKNIVIVRPQDSSQENKEYSE